MKRSTVFLQKIYTDSVNNNNSKSDKSKYALLIKNCIRAISSKLLIYFSSHLNHSFTFTPFLMVYIFYLLSGLWMPISSKQKQIHLQSGQVLIEPCLQPGQRMHKVRTTGNITVGISGAGTENPVMR